MLSESTQSQLKHSLGLALPFQILWLAAALITDSVGGSVHIGLILALIPVLWAPAVLELITRTPVPTLLQVHFNIFVTLSAVAGSSFGFYGVYLSWDTLVHMYSGVILAWLGLFVVQCVENGIHRTLPRWFTLAIATSSALTFAALWEMYEYLNDILLGTAMQAGGLEDTIIDMIAGGVGAGIAIGFALKLKLPKNLLPRSLK